jgi:DNA invertase Pin-like site-specific DNA recombinase
MTFTTKQANKIIDKEILTKKGLAEELGISRPTLDKRLTEETKWKVLEEKWIKHLLK